MTDAAVERLWAALRHGHRSAAVAALLGCSTVAQALTVTGLGPPHSYDLPVALFPEHLEEFAAEWFSRFLRNPKARDRLVGVDSTFDWARDGLIAPPVHDGAVLLLATSSRGASSGRRLLDYLEARPVLIDVTMRRVFDVDGIKGASLAQRDDGAAPGDRMDDFVVPELVRRGHWSVDFVEDGITRALDRGQTPYLRRWFLGLRDQVVRLRWARSRPARVEVFHARRSGTSVRTATPPDGGATMGIGDKISNAAEDVAGKAKEATGRATDNERLEAEGRTDQSKSDVKQAGENVKDAFKR